MQVSQMMPIKSQTNNQQTKNNINFRGDVNVYNSDGTFSYHTRTTKDFDELLDEFLTEKNLKKTKEFKLPAEIVNKKIITPITNDIKFSSDVFLSHTAIGCDPIQN